MPPFEPEGVYCSIPYRVLRDSSVEAMMPGGLVNFRNMDLFLAASGSPTAHTSVEHSIVVHDAFVSVDKRKVPTRPHDYYTILQEAIKTAKSNSSQLRALVYERARFNLKRDILYGHSSLGLADLIQQVKDFELAVAHIEANTVDDQFAAVEQTEEPDGSYATPSNENEMPRNEVEILPAWRPTQKYAELSPIRWTDNFQNVRWPEEFLRYVRAANRFTAFALLGIAFVGAIVITATLWPSPRGSRPVEIASKAPRVGLAAVESSSSSENAPAPIEAQPKLPFPLPTSFGIYALNDSKLTELEPLPISVPDARVALSAEIKNPSAASISGHKPAFILFRRDLLNNAPQKVMLRVIARTKRETKIVNGKPQVTNVEGSWRVRDISRELKVSPMPGQREMLMARLDDDVSLPAGRYALVVNRLGYDFTIDGSAQASEFCLEGFETANGTVFTQCRTP